MSTHTGTLPPSSTQSSTHDEVEQMKLANHYLRVALDQVNEGVIMMDAGPLEGTGPRVLYSNVPIACLVGVEPGKGLRGLFLADLVANERDLAALLSAMKSASEGGAAECQAQIQTFYSRGSRYCAWRVKALHNSMKRLLNFTITIQPLPSEFSIEPSEQGNQPKGEDLDAQAERLRIENLAAMAQGIAHDVNNLLGPITTQLSYIMPQIEKSSELGQTLDVVLTAVKRAKQFTSQVVKASKARHSVMQPTEIGEIIRDTVRLAQAGSNVDVRVKIKNDLFSAMADPIKITQVLQNLVLNGIQAMPSGGFMDVEAQNVDVRLGQEDTLRPGSYVEVVVRDRGAGIAPENLNRLFKESFTTKSDGNGIGLTTCKRFIDEHQGAIRVSSTLRVGTEFRILLPATVKPAAQTAPVTPARSTGTPIKGSLPQGHGNVLIVDDDAQIRSIAAFILKRCGYTVYQSDSGESAVKTYQHMSRTGEPIDVILMDLTLRGGMEGLEASRAIWKFDPGARIIVSSGSVTDDVQRTFVDQGFFAILPKPYEAQELTETVYQAVMSGEALVC